MAAVEQLTKAEYSAKYNGNRERVGELQGIVKDDSIMRIKADGWKPVLGDMFFVEGLHTANPQTKKRSGFDLGFVVQGVTYSAIDDLWLINFYPPVILSGPYRNAVSIPPNGAAIYQPAGEYLRQIHEWWLAHAK